RPEAPAALIIIPRAQIVHPQVGIELLAGEAVAVGGAAAAGNRCTEGIVGVAIGGAAAGVGQGTHAAQAVDQVVAGRPGAADQAVLAEQVVAIGVGALHRATGQLLDHLWVAGGVQVVDQVGGGGSAGGL